MRTRAGSESMGQMCQMGYNFEWVIWVMGHGSCRPMTRYYFHFISGHTFFV